MKVKALTNVWFGSKEYCAGDEFEYDDGADLRAAIAVGKVEEKPDEKVPDRPVVTPYSDDSERGD